MWISNRARSAINALLDIAIHGKQQAVTLADIGKRQGVSKSHLEHLFKQLRLNGLVTGQRGPGGGYMLQRGLAGITVADVIVAVDGDVFEHGKPGTADPDEPAAMTAELWWRVDRQLRHYLCTLTLESALDTAIEAERARERAEFVLTVPVLVSGSGSQAGRDPVAERFSPNG
jgi:Rrf2 family iron-sulfur cluster assembly transcriptional regulator